MQHKLHCIATPKGRALALPYVHHGSTKLPRITVALIYPSLLLALVSLTLLSCGANESGKTACLPSDIWTEAADYGERIDEEAELEPLPGSIANNLLWQPIPEEFDPFFVEAGDDIEVCPPAQWAPETEHEGVWFTIETTLCGYLTVGQPLLTDLKKGDTIRVRIWHYRITVGDGPAKLQMAIGCDGDALWSATLDIPTEKGGLVMDTWTAPRDFAAGEPIFYNVDNHGANSWGLIEMAIIEPEEE